MFALVGLNHLRVLMVLKYVTMFIILSCRVGVLCHLVLCDTVNWGGNKTHLHPTPHNRPSQVTKQHPTHGSLADVLHLSEFNLC